jgi:hypothetical protein
MVFILTDFSQVFGAYATKVTVNYFSRLIFPLTLFPPPRDCVTIVF